jgi:hypothetical protein
MAHPVNPLSIRLEARPFGSIDASHRGTTAEAFPAGATQCPDAVRGCPPRIVAKTSDWWPPVLTAVQHLLSGKHVSRLLGSRFRLGEYNDQDAAADDDGADDLEQAWCLAESQKSQDYRAGGFQ